MRLEGLRLQNFRSYQDTERLDLGAINVFVGPNNAGKSTLLKAIHLLQEGHGIDARDIRFGAIEASTVFAVEEVKVAANPNITAGSLSIKLKTNEARDHANWNREILTPHAGSAGLAEFPAREPHHVVLPFYSHRKAAGYTEDTRETTAIGIHSNLSNLAAKLSRLANPSYPGHDRYTQTCKQILGEAIFTLPGDSGQQVGRYVGSARMTLRNMGDGIPHILGMLIDLSTAENKIFLMEEPENDLHPQALKALLDLIVEQSEINQFFITTHSNIVVRHLASRPNSKLFRVAAETGVKIPTATVTPVDDEPRARMEVLRELGYTLSDFELWEGWLILEESSAQRVISEFLIPMFAPKLAGLCLVSAGGVDSVEPVFQDFMRLVLFTHLQQPYRSRTWVRVDGDTHGAEVVGRLRKDYSDWPEDRFATFTAKNFEEFYPAEFAERATEVLAITDRQRKRTEKRQLLLDVVAWLREDRPRAKKALQLSAKAVISDLMAIEVQL